MTRALSAAEIADRVSVVLAEVRALGGPGVEIVAVTKGHDVEIARHVLAAGVQDLGENVAAELAGKAALLREARWHAIGRVQRNKVRVLAPLVHLWHSVDRHELGTEIARRAPGATVLVQVNASGEPQKGGCEPSAVPDLVEHLYALGLEVRGVMTIGVAGDREATRSAFRRTAAIADALDLPVRSMGMSEDWRDAIEAGSTMVRIGRALVGERAGPRQNARSVGD